jgi:large subunit ribosomal protein L16
MIHPKRTKYRKYHKGRAKGVDYRSHVHFGDFGLSSNEATRLTESQIEACRVAITRKIKKIGRIWIRIFADIPVSGKPTEVRMGKGKGAIDYWACRVKKGKVLFEVGGVSMELAKKALALGAAKLPIKTTFVQKQISISNENPTINTAE